MSTMSDVARKAAVSRFTVSKVLNGDVTVKAAIKARVLAACVALDFSPNPHAVSLVRGSTRSLGLLVTQISDAVPAYQEQAIFTPDMKTVIMMTNRSHTSPDSWANLIVAAAQRVKFDAPDTGSSQTLQFLSDFVGPD